MAMAGCAVAVFAYTLLPGNGGLRGMRQMGRFRVTIAAMGLLIGPASIATSTAWAGDPDFLTISLGGFDVNDNETSAEFLIEYRMSRKYLFLKPMVGLMGNSEGGIYGYGGINLDIFFSKRWVVMPSFAIGGYRRGGSKDLRSIIEFRSGLEFAYRFDDRSRLGVAFSHISNASISDNNPGAESLVLNYSIALGGGG